MAVLSFLPVAALAVGPHEVLVLANESSAKSVGIAKGFARLRAVPAQNLVRLRLPESVTDSPATISPEDFTRMIWKPSWEAAKERGIDGQIVAWVYSSDFPVRVSTSPEMSVLGLTFLRNRVPAPEEIDRARYVSPLFAGPSNPSSAGYLSQSFDLMSEWLGADMPLPAMMLGFTGERGNSFDQVMACIEKGAQSDGTSPAGTVYFVTGADIRSQCREWEYPLAVKELAKLGVHAVIADQFPAGRRDVMGIMMGAADVQPEQIGAYLPGAIAEHLTSAGAVFSSGNQTKISAWIASGATATAGAVSEPYAAWMKFPHARFFVHYASGCTMIESFYQALRCPLQMLLIGDPLAQPWAPRDQLRIAGMDTKPAPSVRKLRAEVDPAARAVYGKVIFLVDGLMVGTGRDFELDTRTLADGSHVLRAVAFRSGMVRSQIFAEQEFTVYNAGKR